MVLGMRPRHWQRVAVYTTTILLFATGVAWLVAHFYLRSSVEPGLELPSPIEPWALRLHGISGQIFLFVFGSMSAAHVVTGWRLRRNRWSGSAVVAVSTFLALTALMLYYAAEEWHWPVSTVHWVVGLTLVPIVAWHVVAARRARSHSAGINA